MQDRDPALRIVASDSRGFGDPPGTNAPGAHFDVLRPSIHHHAGALKVRQPTPLGHVVRVRDITSGHRALAADFTSLRHFSNPPQGSPQGVELNSTGGFIFQVSAPILAVFFRCWRVSLGDRTAGLKVEFPLRKGGGRIEFPCSWRLN